MTNYRLYSVILLGLLLSACDPTPAQRLAHEKQMRDSIANIANKGRLDSIMLVEQEQLQMKADSAALFKELMELKTMRDSIKNAAKAGLEVPEAAAEGSVQ